MSVSDEGEEGPVIIVGAGEVYTERYDRDSRERAALLRAAQPAGAVFALGWVMAELFDPRRRVSVTMRQPPFDPDTQLPQVSDLAADPKLVYLAAQLTEYLRWFPRLHRALRLVTAQTGKRRQAVQGDNEAVAEAAVLAAEAAERGGQPDDVARAEAAAAAVAAQWSPATGEPFSEIALLAAVAGLNQAILDEFADDPERLSAYQLGLTLSDLVWLPSVAATARSAAGGSGALLSLFARPHLATVQTLLNGAGTQLPTGAATIVSRSLSNWAEWIDVNSARVKAPESADVVLKALRVQGWVWRSVLIANPEVSVQPSMGAWVQAASSTSRAAGKTSAVILRRFWPVVLIAFVVLGLLLAFAIANLSGAAAVWTSLAAVAAVLGGGGWSLSSAVSSALEGVGYEIWNTAKTDAAAWNVTWLPALNATTAERLELERRGVDSPHLRKSLDTP
jgi:hypothetical protein